MIVDQAVIMQSNQTGRNKWVPNLAKTLNFVELAVSMAGMLCAVAAIHLSGKVFRIALIVILTCKMLAALIVCLIVRHRYLQ